MALILEEYYDTNTTEMYLSGRNLTIIPENIFKLTKLEVLHLNHNNITKIPKQIAHLKKLKSLKLSYNKLNHIPSEIFMLTELEHLHLSHNKIHKIALDILKLSHLKELYLFGNNIYGLTLPKYINNYKQIKEQLDNFDTKLEKSKQDIARIHIQIWLRYNILPKYYSYDDTIYLSI